MKFRTNWTSVALIFFLMTSLVSCSQLGTNVTKNGALVVNGGIHQGLSWKDKLVFKRTTWFSDLSMLYDVLIADLELNSPFLKWFYYSEREEIRKCEKFVVLGLFSSSDRKTSENEIVQQVVSREAKIVNINGFYKNLSYHPIFSKNSLNLYRFEGVCFPQAFPRDKLVHIPGFSGANVYK
mgnify:CR=1 FL=1